MILTNARIFNGREFIRGNTVIVKKGKIKGIIHKKRGLMSNF